MSVSFQQGAVHKRPPSKNSQAHGGVQPLSPLTYRTQKFQPLPDPLGQPPYHYDIKTAIPDIEKRIARSKKIVFHAVGDVGGVKHAEYQANVAAAMKRDLYNLADNDKPLFFYLLGDVVYYNGQYEDYYNQFYEPYDHYDAPIFAIPGNHDGDPLDNSHKSLDGWVKYFMTSTPDVDPASKDAPRVTMSLPYVYYTLITPLVTIIGIYTNVPEHGSVDSQQQQWLTNEFATASKDLPIILCLHHPVYSFDDHHSGSPLMADVVQHAINDSRRLPNIVLTAHVHNYQRIEKELIKGTPTPFIVSGNGGYYHLHHLNAETGYTDPAIKSKLVYGNDKQHGYLTLTVDPDTITGKATLIDMNNVITDNADTFSYSAKAMFLTEHQVVSL